MHLRTIASVLLTVVALVIFFAPAPPGFSPLAMKGLGIVVFAIGMWAMQALPEHLTGLLFLLLVVITQTAPPNVAFSGFTSGTLWLVLGGLFIAEAVRATALGERFALALLGRFTDSYVRLVTATVVVSTLLCFVMPATMGRVLLLIPILAALAKRIGFEPGSPGYAGLILAAILSTFQIGTTILPANAPNLMLAGAAESIHGVHLSYGEYLWAQFPVLGLLKMPIIVVVTCRLFPARIHSSAPAHTVTPLSPAEWRLTAILLGALVLWATDVSHGIRPGWIALAAGLLVILPKVGVIPMSSFNDNIRYGPYFYIGALLGMGAVITHTGAGAALGAMVFPVLGLERGEDFRNFIALTLLSSVACLVTTNPVQPGLLAPLATQIAEATGWSIESALMTAALGFSNTLLPYAVPPLVVGMQLAGIGLRDAARYTVTLATASLLILVPLDFLWWRVIGYFE